MAITGTGSNTIPCLLAEAASKGIEVYVWHVNLSTGEFHIECVWARARRGGHDIAAEHIRRRYDHSRLNLIDLLPRIAALRVYDNSAEADPAAGKIPKPKLVLHMKNGKILNRHNLRSAPNWAKPIVAAALKLKRS